MQVLRGFFRCFRRAERAQVLACAPVFANCLFRSDHATIGRHSWNVALHWSVLKAHRADSRIGPILVVSNRPLGQINVPWFKLTGRLFCAGFVVVRVNHTTFGQVLALFGVSNGQGLLSIFACTQFRLKVA